jgi:hypothetical protein
MSGYPDLVQLVADVEREIESIKGRTLTGLRYGVALIHTDMQTKIPLEPEDTGNLRASWFYVGSRGAIYAGEGARFRAKRSPDGGISASAAAKAERLRSEHYKKLWGYVSEAKAMARARGPSVIFGYTAYYAPIVHEMPEGVNWTRPGSGPKFLEAAVRRNRAKIVAIIKSTVWPGKK